MLSEILHQNKLFLEKRTSYMVPYLAEIMDLVKKLEVIAGPDFWEALKRKELRKNEFLLLEGEADRHFWILVNGLARVYATIDGQEITQYIFSPGEVINTFASSAPQCPSIVYIQAVLPSEVYVINRNTIKKLRIAYPVLSEIRELMMDGQANWLNLRLQRMQHSCAAEQYLYMVHHQGPIVKLISVNLIASYLGITPQSLSRIRKIIK